MQKFKILLLLVAPILFSIGKLQSQNLTDSNLPIILITTDNDPSTGNPYIIPNDPKVSGSIKILRRPDGSRNYLHDQYVPEMWHYNGRIAIETRGQSSQELPKKAYAFHTMSPDDSDKTNASLLGLPSENNWILNGFAFDPSMMRDVISYQFLINWREIWELMPQELCIVSL
ncbi:MAG: hypothetical protein GX879_08155 [Bacteroidales bacterium]|nr:hypothetical protein [Bacteroidales bacterium]